MPTLDPIETNLNIIESAITGEEMRDAIHDAISGVYSIVKNHSDEINVLKYVPVEITSIRITDPSNGVVLLGSVVGSVSMSWVLKGIPSSQTLSPDGAIDSDDTSTTITYDPPISGNKTFTLSAEDNGITGVYPPAHSTKSITLNFYNYIYYGVGGSTFSVDGNKIEKILSGNKSRNITVNAGTNEYIWYAIPSRLGTCAFNVGGFDGGFEPPTTVSITNTSGYSENYYVYRSTNSSLGNTTVTIK